LPKAYVHDTLIPVTVQPAHGALRSDSGRLYNEYSMSRTCQLTGRGTQTGNKISHSKRHTRRTFKVNIQTKRISGMKLKLSTKALRTLAKVA
jgi:large subunit ribosomal protein L28